MKNKKDLPDQDSDLYKRMKSHLYSKGKLLGEDSPFSELLQTMVNKMLDGEMDSFMSKEHESKKVNKRNDKLTKQVLSDIEPLFVETPRDRNGEFEPQLIEKRQRELSSGLDDQIIALNTQGNSIEDVRRLLMKTYGVDISSGKISQITYKVLPVIRDWQERPLKPFYPVLYLDAIHFKVRYEGKYETRAFYTVYSVDWEGQRDLLGMYMQSSEGISPLFTNTKFSTSSSC